MCGPLYLKRRNDEPLVLDGDAYARSWSKAGGLDPATGEFHPRRWATPCADARAGVPASGSVRIPGW